MEEFEYEERISAISQWTESLRIEMARILSEDPPRIIYHYTDTPGLLGLMDSGNIWATHVSRLNDSSEYRHGIQVVAECVRNAMPESSKPLVEKILEEFKQVDTYIASYSTKHDLLSQWRSYSGTGVGYCLGLATDGIATIDDSTPLLEPVIYKDSTAQDVITKLLLSVDEYLKTKNFGEVEIDFLLGYVGATLANLSCMIKHPKFEEENEFRQFYQPVITSSELEQHFRDGGFGLTPYVKLPFRENGRIPLRSIMIGPCQDIESEINSVKALLEKYLYKGVEILVSEVPLRR